MVVRQVWAYVLRYLRIFLTCRTPRDETVRKPHNDDCLTETSVRKPSLKELAQQVIDRHDAEHQDTASLSPIQEAARRQVLAQLDANPNARRAFVNWFNEDGTLVITLAVRGLGTAELKIASERFNRDSLDDCAALLNIIAGAP